MVRRICHICEFTHLVSASLKPTYASRILGGAENESIIGIWPDSLWARVWPTRLYVPYMYVYKIAKFDLSAGHTHTRGGLCR